jgi:diguanylate cyclase (GGDEF)-like protein
MALNLPPTADVNLRQRDLVCLLPGGLLVLTGVLLFHLLTLSEEVHGFFAYYPFLVLALGLFLSWRFNRTRLFFALLLLTLADLLLRRFPDGETRLLAIAAAEFLIPLNLAMISFFSERGLFSRPGLQRSGVIAAQPLLIYLTYQGNSVALSNFLIGKPLPWAFLDRLPLAQIPLAGLLLGGGILFSRFPRHPSAIDGGFLWALVATIGPLLADVSNETRTLWFATAGLILTVSLIESSHRMAYRDELTGLPSRRALNEELLKVGRTYTLAMVDIDHFKKVNDTYGHDVGDQVLKMVAAQIEEVSGGGRPYRFGGEEFTVFFPSKSAREALPHLEELRHSIEMSGFTLRDGGRPKEKPEQPVKGKEGQRLKVTASIGVAERNDFNPTPEAVLKAADKALYRAKEQGRNCVVRSGAKLAAKS